MNIHKRIFYNNTNINDNNNNNLLFKFDINSEKIKKYLSYIYVWNGLNLSTTKIIKTKKEYMIKARNWLNGRRTKQYGHNLFVDMINQSVKVK